MRKRESVDPYLRPLTALLRSYRSPAHLAAVVMSTLERNVRRRLSSFRTRQASDGQKDRKSTASREKLGNKRAARQPPTHLHKRCKTKSSIFVHCETSLGKLVSEKSKRIIRQGRGEFGCGTRAGAEQGASRQVHLMDG